MISSAFTESEFTPVPRARSPIYISPCWARWRSFIFPISGEDQTGQLGRALQGKIPGGRAFGYDVVPRKGNGRATEGGERTVNEPEAAVVDASSGTSPMA